MMRHVLVLGILTICLLSAGATIDDFEDGMRCGGWGEPAPSCRLSEDAVAGK